MILHLHSTSPLCQGKQRTGYGVIVMVVMVVTMVTMVMAVMMVMVMVMVHRE